MNRDFRGQAGFSLVELLVAVLILAVGLLGLAELQITTMKANAQGDSTMAVNNLVQKIIEEVAAAPSDDPRFNVEATNQAWTPATFTIAGAGDYNVTYSVNTGSPPGSGYGGIEGLSQVTVNVASAGSVMHVLGARQRLASMTTLKRTY